MGALPRHCVRRAWIEAWQLERDVTGADRWLLYREGDPVMLVHPGTKTVHVLGSVRAQRCLSLPRAAARLDDLCGADSAFLTERIGERVASCGNYVARGAALPAPSPTARVCRHCARVTPGWDVGSLRERARETHDERVAEDVDAALRVAANLGVSS